MREALRALVRAERPDDADAIRAVLTSCFPTAEEAHLVDDLRAAGRMAVSLVAEIGGRVIGHVAFSPVTTERGETGWGLAPLAVLPEFRRRGVGSALVAAGLDACRSAGSGWCVVLGDPAYYSRFGFEPAIRAGLVDEYGGGDAFQVTELRSGALPHGAGLVRYAPEFASLE